MEIYELKLLQIIRIDLFCFHSTEANGNHLSPGLSQLIWKKKKKLRKNKTPQVHLLDLPKVWYKCAYICNHQDAFNI